MSQVITNAFEQYWQSCLAAEKPVVLDEFILADIPNLDITSPIDPDAGLPPESQIVHRQNVDQRGRINNNAVAYTIVMDTTVGDFSFNAMYLRNKQNGVIGMIVYKGRETKLKTDQTTGQTGNSLVKSMLMGYDQAAEATLTHVDAGTWQIDYAARLRGMDEDIRQLQADLYGHHTFVGDGFKVVEKDGAYQVTQGVAIVGGLRVELKAPEVIHPGTKPIGVWVDVHRAGSLLSEHQNHFTIITSVADLTDHVDSNGYQHYVAKLATVLADGTIEDGRGTNDGSGNIGTGAIQDNFSLWKRAMDDEGYDLIGRFGSSLTINTADQVVLSKDGQSVYAWEGSLPKEINKDDDGSDASSWRNIEKNKTCRGSYGDIRAYCGSATRIDCYGRDHIFDGANGIFALDDSDHISSDDDGVVLVDAMGRRWKRVYSGYVNVLWWGAKPSDDSEASAKANTVAFRRATLSFKSDWVEFRKGLSGRSVYVPAGDFNLSNGVCVPPGCALFSDGLAVSRLKILGETADKTNKIPLVSLGRVINDESMQTEVSTGAYVVNPPPYINNLYLNPQDTRTALDISGVPGFNVGTLWIQADKGVVISGGSGDGIIENLFLDDKTGYGVEIGNCQNITIDNIYSFVCKVPLVYSGSSNNTVINNLQANYTLISTLQTLDGAVVRGAKIGRFVSKHNMQYSTFESVILLRSESCDIYICEMDARNYRGYALNNASGLGNNVRIGFLKLRQESFNPSDNVGISSKGCRVNNMSLIIDVVDIGELGFSAFEVVGDYKSNLVVKSGSFGGFNSPVPVCNIDTKSELSNVEIQVEPPKGCALFNLQDVIVPIYDKVRKPFPIVEESGRKAIKIPFSGEVNCWRVTISASTNPSGNAKYKRTRRFFIAHETSYDGSMITTNLSMISDGNSALNSVYSPDIACQSDIDVVGYGSKRAYGRSGYAVLSVPAGYMNVSFSVEQQR